ncbi:RpiB/LacA/LacB family sugar-phosphate isomerase [Candidatus Saccharibacteria bacterium]|jgi:ribose 5-phosphate isomerase B|nr:RpiB/LacA/LacB family sugar-phosphate isomerase [Candidatus Saccharibacteria bacterium]MDO4730425.1 RpiB/LacA/LacB family sugar-phosphate isomerase [Candidatus Saccharibacteria bacterium]
MQIFLGADHRGMELKGRIANWLASQEIVCIDCGNVTYDAEDDYNDFAKAVVSQVYYSKDPQTFGILICGSAQGMAMQANRYKGIRAAICHSPEEAVETRGHNDANILCLAADEKLNFYGDIIDKFIHTAALPDEKYLRRKQKLDEG